MAARELATGIVIGMAAAVSIPLVIAAVGPARKPMGRAMVRSGRILRDKAREAGAELLEVAEDLIAELKEAQAAEQLAGTVLAAEDPPRAAP